MGRKRISFILFASLGIIIFVLLLRQEKNYKYDLKGEDIREVLAIKSINEIAISTGQAMEKAEESKKIEEAHVDKNSEEKLDKKDELAKKEKTGEETSEKADKNNQKDTTIAQNTHNKHDTPSRGNTNTDNRKEQENSIPNFNKYVLDIIKTYSLEPGKYPYLLNGDFENYNGVTEDLYYKGELLLKANPSGDRASNCTGITFEVFFKAMQRRNKDLGLSIDDFNGMSKDQLFDFILTWFVAMGDKSESNLTVAIEKYGLGNRIYNLENLRPGDFMDFSRENNTGHAVIFINWIRKEGQIIGFKYWSSQGSTNGISYKEEYFNIKDKFGNKYGNVIIDSLHLARVN